MRSAYPDRRFSTMLVKPRSLTDFVFDFLNFEEKDDKLDFRRLPSDTDGRLE